MSGNSGIDLSGDISDRVNAAPTTGKPLILSYVDSAGQPHISVRASIHVHSNDQLAMWIREGYVGTMTPTRATPDEGGFVNAIDKNPLVALFYRDTESRTTYVFSGRARKETDPKLRDAIFESMSQSEQNHSPERTGTAVVIDIDHVVGGTLGQGGVTLSKVEMSRS